jgi:hypothetical protein
VSIVAGADFGTLSVRISIFDRQRGKLGSALAEYPLHSSPTDPHLKTQSHDDQMNALAKASSRSASITSGATIARQARPPKSRAPRTPSTAAPALKELTGVAVSTRPSGVGRSCCIGCATILACDRSLSLRLSTATWWPRRSAA